MVIGGLVMSFVMDRTYFGRYVFALGGNESAARLAGINVKRMKYAIGCIAGFFCGIGAIILTSRVGAAAAGTAAGFDAFQIKRRAIAANKRKEEKAKA